MAAATVGTFVDQARIEVNSGRGGDGASHFRREKYAPRGGPDGGEGGRGGDVILRVDEQLRTLVDFRFHRKFSAGDGAAGFVNDRTGAMGEACYVPVPPGTLVYDDETGRLLADLADAGQELVVCRGGRGGHGNAFYATPVNRAPIMREKGEPGVHRVLRLELKLLADAALVGYPNAGKSTLISRLSAARPKIANYPFTTLAPNLGVVRLDDGASYVIADLPGLIDGASEGKGLGHQFLAHIERARVIVHVLDISGFDREDPLADYLAIRHELAAYDPGLAALPELVAANKADLLDDPDSVEELIAALEAQGAHSVHLLSAVTGEGVAELAQALGELVFAAPVQSVVAARAADEADAPPEPVVPDDQFEIVEEDEGVFAVVGRSVERLFAMTDTGNSESLMNLHRVLTKLGVIDALRQAGCLDGDLVRIGDEYMDFQE